MSLLELADIRKNFGTVEALRGVSFSVDAGSVVGLVGDNGAGKSTLMKTITGVYRPDGGEIRFDGASLADKDPHVIRELGIEMIYQDLALAEMRDVASNIFLGREITRNVLGFNFIDYKRMEIEAGKMIEKLGARVKSVKQPAGLLSRGQQQSVAIARALTFNPKLVIMDEPTAALAVREIEHVLDLIRNLKSRGIAVILISHRLTDVFAVCDRIVVLRHGAVIADDATAATSMNAALENTRLYADLKERETRIRRLVDANIVGIFVADIEGRIFEANDAFLRILGYDRNDLASGRVRRTELTPPEWRERDERALAELRSTGSFQPIEKEYFRKDGSRVPVLVGVALFERGGEEGVAFVLDLTERKRAEQALRELESEFAHMNRVSMMGELTASLSHEVTQPIASARNNAQAALNFLDLQPPDLGEVREALGSIVDDADRAGDIIERIREQIKKAPPRKEIFDLNETIDEVIELAQSAIVRNGVSIQRRFAEGVLAVNGDRIQLQQVVMNLVLNAVEAMSSVEAGTRELVISTGQNRTDGVIVAVQDSGPGIDAKNIERVFEAFYTTKSSGTGMGLSICRSIIDAHGGRLWAEANEPRGAVFQFTLPRA
jgi:PAS domain S-box-containing protein